MGGLDMTTKTAEDQTAGTPAGEETPDGRNTDIRQFVTFMAKDEVFAVDMAPVHEIIRVPEVVRVPLSPPTLEGLANLRGKVLPIISLRRLFGFEEQAYDDATRAVVIDMGQPLGFVVDKVASVIGVEPGKIEDVGAISSTVNTELLAGLIKDINGHAMIMILDFAKLIAGEFNGISSLAKTMDEAGGMANDKPEEETASDELQLVSFEVAGQEYAMAIESVQEIVQVPENIVHIPNSESHVIGLMILRNRLLPLVNLRRVFNLPDHEVDDHCRIVVVSVGEIYVGIVMDSVNEVLRVAKADVDVMPGLLARDGDMADISGICRLGDGKRLVSIISADNLFRHLSIKEALMNADTLNHGSEQQISADNQENKAHDDDEQVVVFRLGKEEFGIPIASVQEIVRVPEQLTHVPKAPAFVEGVINLRGAVLPVIDLRRRLGLPPVERSDRHRVMVFLINGLRTGFIVDMVTEVLKIPKHLIEPAPRLSNQQTGLLARMANIEKQKRMVQLIDPAHLVEKDEMVELSGISQ